MQPRQRKSSRIVPVDDAAEAAVRNLKQTDFEVEFLPGPKTITSPLTRRRNNIVSDSVRRLLYDPTVNTSVSGCNPELLSSVTLRLAHPRRTLHFDPGAISVGIVTCGGLCPGLNDVIRAITSTCTNSYNVKRVIGFRYGFWGLSAEGRDTMMMLDDDVVRNVHRDGGTFLGSSRGAQSFQEMVDTLVMANVQILFTVGGDGTQRGALSIVDEVKRRGLNIGVMGVPKTIDNDLSFSQRTFGFETAVEQATIAIEAAYAEADSASFGIGIVKLMGRHSGFIAAHATIASGRAHICLIPENPVAPDVVMSLIERRFQVHDTCVIVVAEGFGQDWVETKGPVGKDASGNAKLIDIGVLLKSKVEAWCKSTTKYKHATIKYIDPSYMIRACRPNASDAAFCLNLATLAVHEAMSGVTGAVMSYWYDNFVTIPIKLATSMRKCVCLNSTMWRLVREVTTTTSDVGEQRQRMQLTRRVMTLTQQRESAIVLLSKL